MITETQKFQIKTIIYGLNEITKEERAMCGFISHENTFLSDTITVRKNKFKLCCYIYEIKELIEDIYDSITNPKVESHYESGGIKVNKLSADYNGKATNKGLGEYILEVELETELVE